MKTIGKWLLLAFIFTSINSCKKEQSYKKIKFPKTTYSNLTSYDSNGKPQGLIKDVISDDLWNFVLDKLPEGNNLPLSNPELFTTDKTADITITQTADIYVTFVKGVCYYPNSLAYYTYPTAQPPQTPEEIEEIVYFFPNIGQSTPLQRGDKIKIGRFTPGTSIGFVLMQQSWDSKNKKLDHNVLHFCSHDILNPELDPKLKKHAVLLNYTPEDKVIVGFEDILRTSPNSDHDFNDVVFYCTAEL